MTNPIPAGHEGIIPHLIVDGCSDAIEFYRKAFNAEEIHRAPAPGGSKIMHAEIRINGRPIFLCDDFPEFCGGQSRSPKSLGASPVTIHQFVTDCDAAIKQAAAAGANVTTEPADMFWGDRYGTVEDPWGYTWSFATHVRDMTPEEMEEEAKAAFAQAPGS